MPSVVLIIIIHHYIADEGYVKHPIPLCNYTDVTRRAVDYVKKEERKKDFTSHFIARDFDAGNNTIAALPAVRRSFARINHRKIAVTQRHFIIRTKHTSDGHHKRLHASTNSCELFPKYLRRQITYLNVSSSNLLYSHSACAFFIHEAKQGCCGTETYCQLLIISFGVREKI